MEAINEFKRLTKTRTCPSFWTANIVDAHGFCKSKNDHKHFWAFLTNPGEYNPDKVENMKTIGDRVDEVGYKCGIQDLPEELTQDIYQNGNEITIRTRRKDIAIEHDEKCPEMF
jgi:hypothetical protein